MCMKAEVIDNRPGLQESHGGFKCQRTQKSENTEYAVRTHNLLPQHPSSSDKNTKTSHPAPLMEVDAIKPTNRFYRLEAVDPGYTETLRTIEGHSTDRGGRRGSIMCIARPIELMHITPMLAINVVVCRRGICCYLPVVLTTTPEELFWRDSDCWQ